MYLPHQFPGAQLSSAAYKPLSRREAASTGSRLSLLVACLSLLLGAAWSPQMGRAAQTVQQVNGAVKATQAGTAEGTPTATATPPTARAVAQAIAQANQPTRTPRPTATLPAIPPPADPTSSNLMIVFALIVIAVILFGIWLNRRRAF